MLLDTLQRKLDTYAERDPGRFDGPTELALPGGAVRRVQLGTTASDIERMREAVGGRFGHRTGRWWLRRNLASGLVPKLRSAKRACEDFVRGDWLWEPTSDWAWADNIVVNEGLAYVMDVAFREVTDIAPWYNVIYTDAGTYTPAAGDTYATPNYDEADGADIDETVRQAWVDQSPTGTTTRSVAGAAVTYTGDQSFTAQGASIVGGGTAATTLQDTAGGGTLYCASDFASTVAMTLDATVDVTHTLTGADDGA